MNYRENQEEYDRGVVDAISALLYETHATTSQEDVLLAAFGSPRISGMLVHEARDEYRRRVDQGISSNSTEYATIQEALDAERPWIDPDFLRELYVEKRLSSVEIAQLVGNITDAGVRYWLDKHDIERRDRSEAARERWAKLRDPDHLRRLAGEIEALTEESTPD